MKTTLSGRWLTVGICLSLAALTWLVFSQTLWHDFINYDDPRYVYETTRITDGLSLSGIAWAFTHIHSLNWHPLTTISHMLDCQLYGLKAGWHHFTNVVLHTLAAILLFLALQQMTGAIWRSAFVAAVFAIHPLRVESVAWIAERKDVLSGVFFMLTLLAYVRYVHKPAIGRYVTMSVLFGCGLLSKSMLVTLPIVLLFLDYWPLDRFGDSRSTITKLFTEKIPLFALAVGSCLATLLAQNFALGSTEHLPLKWRITNAIVTYLDYIWQMFWPVDLVPFYIHPENRLSISHLLVSAIILVAITGIAFARRRKNPYILVGWFWYIVMLTPVIGIIQVGLQGRADRYTYLPQIGLYVALVWLIRDLTKSWRQREIILGAAAAIVLSGLSIFSWKQTTHWRDTETLWSHALTITPDSDVAHAGLAGIFLVRGQTDAAIFHYERPLS